MRRLAVVVASLGAVALLAAAPASAGWHFKFQHFIETSKTATAGGITEAKRCAPSVAGDWRLRSLIEVDLATASDPEQSVEFEIKAKLPITTKFRPVHDVDVSWTAKLPKDPAVAALLTEHYERLAKSHADFYETMAVRWRPAKQKLDIEHAGLYYDEIEQLPPGTFTSHFKPKPGC